MAAPAMEKPKRKRRSDAGLAEPDAELTRIERLAVEVASLAGAEITNALGTMLTVRYKTMPEDQAQWRDPVSEVDHRVETLIRARLADSFPEHNIIGEEFDVEPSLDHEFVWAIDPIDGTTNFVNGLPLFAASIGVLREGRPVAGAVWCSSSHRLRAGVYHAHEGGALYFEGNPVATKSNKTVRRRLAGTPDGQDVTGPWESRKTGSAAIECAFVAAGLLEVARFIRPNIWDVAGGIALVSASGGHIRQRTTGDWTMLERFSVDQSEQPGSLRRWSADIILGSAEAVAGMCRRSAAAE